MSFWMKATWGLWKVRRIILTELIENGNELDENLGPLSWVEAAHYLSYLPVLKVLGQCPFPMTD